MGGAVAKVASTSYDLAFQVSPIILVGGSYGQGLMPIIGLLGQLAGLGQGLLSGLGSDAPFAKFLPMPGSTLISNTVGKYPFANQQVAGNAIIQQPLNLSMHMICPVKDKAGYLTKLALITSLQTSLQQHCAAGGTFNVATPAFIYTGMILLGMTDITGGMTAQKQVEFQLDFEKPLITREDATAALNTLMGKLSGGQQVTSSSWSGQAATLPDTPGLPGSVQTYAYGAQNANTPGFQ